MEGSSGTGSEGRGKDEDSSGKTVMGDRRDVLPLDLSSSGSTPCKFKDGAVAARNADSSPKSSNNSGPASSGSEDSDHDTEEYVYPSDEEFKEETKGSSAMSEASAPDPTPSTSNSASKAKKVDYGIAVGIDLGTTFSCVAHTQPGETYTILNPFGEATTPSVVMFDENEVKVGRTAEIDGVMAPHQVIRDAKRVIGQFYGSQDVHEVIKVMQNVSPYYDDADERKRRTVPVTFEIERRGGGGKVRILPEQVSARVLGEMLRIARARLSDEVKSAVITVPAYFSPQQRIATIRAANIAGIKVLRLLNEPTAAAFAYGMKLKKVAANSSLLVFDLGGGTFDVTVVEVRNRIVHVLATCGHGSVGGQNFNDIILQMVIRDLEAKHSKSFADNLDLVNDLMPKIELAKRSISVATSAHIQGRRVGGVVDVAFKLERSAFEKAMAGYLLDMKTSVTQAMNGSKLASFDKIVLAGGSSRIPCVQDLLRAMFPNNEIKIELNPDEIVAQGASMVAACMTGEDSGFILNDIVGQAIGTPRPYLEANGKRQMIKVIRRFSRLPARIYMTYIMALDGKNKTKFYVYQGDSDYVDDNTLLGDITLEFGKVVDIGTPIETIWEMDANGVLKMECYHGEGEHVKAEFNALTAAATELDVPKNDVNAHNEVIAAEVESALEEDRMEATREFENFCKELKIAADSRMIENPIPVLPVLNVITVAENSLAWSMDKVRSVEQLKNEVLEIAVKADDAFLDVPLPTFIKRKAEPEVLELTSVVKFPKLE